MESEAEPPRPRGADGAIPKTVSQRLSQYLRVLQELSAAGEATVSSQVLGRRLELRAAQVRKDLAYFGHFGSPGVGYRVEHLITQVRRILGTERGWSVALVGAGHLGTALLRYKGFEQQGFRITAVFDVDPRRVGTRIDGLEVEGLESLEARVRGGEVGLAVLTVPASEAQAVADRLVEAGVVGILNFAPVRLQLPEGTSLVDVDLAVQLEQLSYLVSLEPDREGEKKVC